MRGKFQQDADELQSRKVLENLADELRTNYALPGPVTIAAKQCDDANAFYDPETHSITYCYELAADMYQKGVDNLFTEDGSSEEDTSAAAD